MANKRDLTIGIDGDPKGFDGAVKSAEESAKAFDRELGKLERELEMTEQRTKAAGDAVQKYGREQDKAALAARKLGNEAKASADKAARAQREYAAAAEELANGEGDAARAEELAARAADAVERAALAAAAAHRAQARAADEAADQERQLARDSELAGAAQRLAILKAGGAVKSHDALIRNLESRFGDLSHEGSGAFQQIEKSGTSAFASIGSSGPGAIALVVAALAAVPFVAVLAEGAISLGVGGALAGLGLAATKSDAEVQAALHQMTSHVKSMTGQIAAPFKRTWIDIADSATDAFDGLVPVLTKDFAKLAPAVGKFAHDAGYAVTQMAPAFDAATDAADDLMAELGPKLPEISRNVGKSVKIMADSAAEAAPEFANTAASVSQLLPPLAHALDLAVKIGPTFNLAYGAISGGATTISTLRSGLSQLTGGLISADHSFQQGSYSGKSFAAQAVDTAIKTHTLATAQQLAALSANEFASALNKLTAANMSEDQAAIAAAQAANAAAKAADHRRKVTLSERSALLNLASADQTVLEKMKENGASADKVSSKMATLRAGFIATAQKMGYTAAQAKALADRYGLLPKSKNTKVTNNAKAAAAAVQAYQNKLNSLHGKTVYVHTVYTSSGSTTFGAGNRKLGNARGGLIGYATGGPVGLADGGPSGMVRGPGTGTSDSIPALLSNKEFVVNAKDTADNLPILEAINAGRKVSAGMLGPRPVSMGGARGGDGASVTVIPPDVHVSIDGQRVFAVVQQRGKEYTSRNHGRSPFATAGH